MKPMFKEGAPKNTEVIKAVLLDEELNKITNKVLPFVKQLSMQFEEKQVLELEMSFKENALITKHLYFFQRSLGITQIEVIVDNTKVIPGKPKISFQ